MNVKIAELRHRIKIQRRESARDDTGAFILETRDLIEVWAKIEPLKSRDLFQANDIWPGTDHRIITRYFQEVEQGTIITWNDKTFEVTHVTDEDYKHQWLEIMCKEITTPHS
jgi:SPP1 family predicted phage head-tail adaptor